MSAAKVVGVVAGGAMAAAAMTAAVVAAETTSAGTNSGATFMAEAPLPRAAMAVDDSARVVRIAVVPAGATLEGTSAAPPSTTDAPFDARVTTLAEAIAWGATHAAGATGIEITLAGAVHEVRDTVRIPADMPRCTIVGAEGARVVGGVLVDASRAPGSRAGGADADGASTGRAPGEPAATPWAQPDPSMLARVAEEARPHLRVWRLPEEVRASLAGPAHSGLQVDTPAVHSELFVGGRALTLARWPNTGYASIGSIVDAGSVQVHFGKNKDTPLSALSDKQLLWYGSDRPAQLKKDGTPFAPREADVQLLNACRTLWHQRKSGAPIALTSQPATADDGENVPF